MSLEGGSTSQTPNAETLASEERVTLYQNRDLAPDRWAALIRFHSPQPQDPGELLDLTPLIEAVPRPLTSGDEHALWEDSNDLGRRHFKSRPS